MFRKKILLKTIVLGIALSLSLILMPFSRVLGKTVDPDLQFYEGKTVNVVVATKAGGGYDAYARMAAPFFKKYLPKAVVIVRNVPGAGHIIGANEIFRSKPDGLTFGWANYKGLIFSQLAKVEGIKFDLNKFSWLANVASEPQVLIVGKKTPYKSVNDLKSAKKPIVMGSAGVGSSSYNYSLMLSKVVGFPLNIVPGYGGSEVDMAMMRGEVEGQIGAYDNMRPMIDNDEARIILVISRNKMPQYPDVPLLSSFVTPENQDLANLMYAMAELGRPIAAPPNIPPGRLKALREALEKSFKDPELLAVSKKMKLPITYIPGEAARQLFANALKQPPQVIKMVKELSESEK